MTTAIKEMKYKSFKKLKIQSILLNIVNKIHWEKL